MEAVRLACDDAKVRETETASEPRSVRRVAELERARKTLRSEIGRYLMTSGEGSPPSPEAAERLALAASQVAGLATLVSREK